MQKQVIHTDKVAPPRGAFSHALRVGNLLFISGQVARDREGRTVGKGDARAQAEQALENIKALLEAAGATFDNVVKLNVYMTNVDDQPLVAEIRRRYMRPPYPASATVGVVALAEPEFLLEIEALAAL